MEPVVFKVAVSSGIFGLSPQLGLEPAPYTTEGLAELYLNGSHAEMFQIEIRFKESVEIKLVVAWRKKQKRTGDWDEKEIQLATNSGSARTPEENQMLNTDRLSRICPIEN
jgi:hypothetical protein